MTLSRRSSTLARRSVSIPKPHRSRLCRGPKAIGRRGDLLETRALAHA
jgi:hypothetical protein